MIPSSRLVDTTEGLSVRSSQWLPFGAQFTLVEPSQAQHRWWKISILNQPGFAEAEVETDVLPSVQLVVTRLLASSGQMYTYRVVPVEQVELEIRRLESDIAATLRSFIRRQA